MFKIQAAARIQASNDSCPFGKKLTSEQVARIKSGIADAQQFIDKEEKRSVDLRPANVQKILDQNKAHVVKLKQWLADAGH